MYRYVESAIKTDLKSKIVLLSGPRQVGKTTLSKQLGLSFAYMNYDARPDRNLIPENTMGQTPGAGISH
jgi:predicted AAA+ superfamily ATPase